MTRAIVGQVICPCATAQPDPATFAIDAVLQCPECGQLWRRSSKRSSNRGGGGIVVHGLLIGGMVRSKNVPVWVRTGRNVAREAATALARAATEEAYVRDAGDLRAAVAAGTVPAGSGVRAYRAHRDALANPTVRCFRGSVAVLAVLAVLGIVALLALGAVSGAVPGSIGLSVVWVAVCGGAARKGVTRRRELRKDVLS